MRIKFYEMRYKCTTSLITPPRLRWGADLKKIVPEAVEREFTDILVVNEDHKMPNGLLVIHLPSGPTAHFKLTSFKRGYNIKVLCLEQSHSVCTYSCLFLALYGCQSIFSSYTVAIK